MAVDTGPMMPEALETNRSGRLTDVQRRNLGALERSNRKSQLTFALLALAFGAIILVVPGFHGSALAHYGIPLLCVILAIGLFAWSLMGADPLQRDLRDGKVESVEGPCGKRMPMTAVSANSQSSYYLDVGRMTFSVGQHTYETAPEAGYLRVYYLPRSKHLVNWERTESGPVPEISSPQDMLREARESLSFDRVRRNEARAGMQAFGEQMQAQLKQNAEPPPTSDRDPRPLAEAIVGTWHGMMMTVTFNADGTVEAQLPGGMKRSGHWSVDSDGRLRSDAMGQDGSTGAWVAGDHLTITTDGMGLQFDRVTGPEG